MVQVHLPFWLDTGQWIGDETIGWTRSFLLMTSDVVQTLTCAVMYILYLDEKLMGLSIIFRHLTDGGRGGLWWTFVFGPWLFCTGCWQCYFKLIYKMTCMVYWILFPHTYPSPCGVSVNGYSFQKTDWTIVPWTSYIPISLTKLWIINRSVPGFPADPSCGIWCRGWTICL